MALSHSPSIVMNGLVLCLDAANTKSYDGNENLLSYSNDFSNGVWAGYCGPKTNITYNTTEVDDPFGTFTSTKIVRNSVTTCTGAVGEQSWGVLWNGSTIVNTTDTFTISLYVRGSVAGDTVQFGFNDSQTSPYTLTTSWQRITYTGIPNSTSRGIQIYINGVNKTYYISGAQVEKGTTANPYYSTTTTSKTRGTTWTDLSGNGHNITLGTSVSFANSFAGVLNFPPDANGYGRNTSMNLSSSNYTVMSFVRKNSNGNVGRTITAYNNNWLLGHHDSTYGDYYAEGWVNDIASPQSDTIWRMFTGTGNISGDSYSLYINDQLVVTNSNGSAGPNGWNLNNQFAQYSDCQISNLICYNRVLTAAEIRQNFNALRGRYSI